MTHSRQAGFSLVEMLIVMSVLIMLLGAIFTTSKTITGTVSASNHRSEVMDATGRVMERIGQLLRPGVLSTFRTRALQADVDAAAADPLIVTVPTLGEWISPLVETPRSTLRFRAADGVLAVNASALTPPIALELVLEPSELRNGKDDDGDGMVDEGRLLFTRESVQLVLLQGVETFEYEVTGSVVRMTLSCARRDDAGHVYRTSVRHVFHVRNS